MKKIKLIRTSIITYEPVSSYYPNGENLAIEEMAKIDVEIAKDNGGAIFDLCNSEVITWEIVDE